MEKYSTIRILLRILILNENRYEVFPWADGLITDQIKGNIQKSMVSYFTPHHIEYDNYFRYVKEHGKGTYFGGGKGCETAIEYIHKKMEGDMGVPDYIKDYVKRLYTDKQKGISIKGQIDDLQNELDTELEISCNNYLGIQSTSTVAIDDDY
jgi:hypothetical protein